MKAVQEERIEQFTCKIDWIFFYVDEGHKEVDHINWCKLIEFNVHVKFK